MDYRIILSLFIGDGLCWQDDKLFPYGAVYMWYSLWPLWLHLQNKGAFESHVNITWSTSVMLPFVITLPLIYRREKTLTCARKWPLPQKGVIGNPIKEKCHAGNCVSQCESFVRGGSHWIQGRGDMWHWSLAASLTSSALLLHPLPNFPTLAFFSGLWSYGCLASYYREAPAIYLVFNNMYVEIFYGNLCLSLSSCLHLKKFTFTLFSSHLETKT